MFDMYRFLLLVTYYFIAINKELGKLWSKVKHAKFPQRISSYKKHVKMLSIIFIRANILIMNNLALLIFPSK